MSYLSIILWSSSCGNLIIFIMLIIKLVFGHDELSLNSTDSKKCSTA